MDTCISAIGINHIAHRLRRAVNPRRHNARNMRSFVQKNHAKKMLELKHLYLTGLLPTNHIIAYITMAY